jgi:hypothetical protein
MESKMTDVQSFMIAAAKISDPDLKAMIRTTMLGQPDGERQRWVRQIELALDGYGERHFKSAERIANILNVLETELQDAPVAAI